MKQFPKINYCSQTLGVKLYFRDKSSPIVSPWSSVEAPLSISTILPGDYLYYGSTSLNQNVCELHFIQLSCINPRHSSWIVDNNGKYISQRNSSPGDINRSQIEHQLTTVTDLSIFWDIASQYLSAVEVYYLIAHVLKLPKKARKFIDKLSSISLSTIDPADLLIGFFLNQINLEHYTVDLPALFNIKCRGIEIVDCHIPTQVDNSLTWIYENILSKHISKIVNSCLSSDRIYSNCLYIPCSLNNVDSCICLIPGDDENILVFYSLLDENKRQIKSSQSFQCKPYDVDFILSLLTNSCCLSLSSQFNFLSKFFDSININASSDLFLKQKMSCEASQFLTEVLHSSHPSSYKSLLNNIQNIVSSEIYQRIVKLFSDYRELLMVNNSPSLKISDLDLYCSLREIFCLVTGRHIVQDPLSSRISLSHSCKGFPSGERLIAYYSELRQSTFYEFRSIGWQDATNVFYLSEQLKLHILWDLPNPKLFSNFHLGEWMKNNIFQPSVHSRCTLSNEKALVVNTFTYNFNLGHILWNEYSGMDFLVQLLMKNQEIFAEIPITFVASNLASAKFSGQSPRAFLYEEFKRNNNSFFSLNNAFLRPVYESSEDLEPVCVSLKSPIVSKNTIRTVDRLAQRYNDKYSPQVISHDTGTSLRHRVKNIFFNIRTRDKSCLNIHKCLELSLQSMDKNPSLAEIKFNFMLDYVDDHELIESCKDSILRYGHSFEDLKSVSLDELASAVSRSFCAVAVVGSGAVLPTWIYCKPSMLHAETSHIRQLDTIWLRTSDFSAQNLYRLKDSDIVDAGDCPRGKPQYDNYTINQCAFSNLFCKMIEENI